MSTLFLSKLSENQFQAIYPSLVLTENSTVEKIELTSVTIISARVDDLSVWGYAHDQETDTTVVLGGRVAFKEAEWNRAKQLPYSGGLACRLLLEKFLNRKSMDDFFEQLNGPFGVIIHEGKDQQFHLITDRLGIYPFYQNIGDELAISTHPDVLADHLRETGSVTLDKVTLAEAIGRSESVFPFTYYEQIRQISPSFWFQYDCETASMLKKEEYWKPAFLDGGVENNRDQIVKELAEAIAKAVDLRTHAFFSNPGLFLSGGIDSRGLLFSARNKTRLTILTYTQTLQGEDYKVAQALSRLAGARNLALTLERDHYVRDIEKAVDLSAGMWSVATDHFTPFIHDIQKENFDVLLTGCYSDYLFKGLSNNVESRKILGKRLPFKRVSDYSHEYYYAHFKLDSKWETAVEQRWQERFKTCIGGIEQSKFEVAGCAEDLRMRPISREADISGRLVLWRTLPWDHLLSDKNILDVYGKIPVSMKSDDRLFSDAVLRLLPKEAKLIRNANTGLRVGDKFYRKAIKKISGNKSAEREASVRSLENLLWLINDKESRLYTIWNRRTAEEEAFFTDLLGLNPWKEEFSRYPKSANHFVFRILTAYVWASQKGMIR